MKKLSILFLSIFLISGFFLSNSVIAQDEPAQNPEDIEAGGEIEEITIDEDITAEDLGIAEPKILPDNP